MNRPDAVRARMKDDAMLVGELFEGPVELVVRTTKLDEQFVA
jgi:hypothetical protein